MQEVRITKLTVHQTSEMKRLSPASYPPPLPQMMCSRLEK